MCCDVSRAHASIALQTSRVTDRTDSISPTVSLLVAAATALYALHASSIYPHESPPTPRTNTAPAQKSLCVHTPHNQDSLNHSYMPTHTTRTAKSHSNTQTRTHCTQQSRRLQKERRSQKEDKNHSPLVTIITRRPCRPSQASRRGVSSDPPPTSSSRNRAAGHSDHRQMAARAGWRPPRLLKGRRPSSRRR